MELQPVLTPEGHRLADLDRASLLAVLTHYDYACTVAEPTETLVAIIERDLACGDMTPEGIANILAAAKSACNHAPPGHR